MDNSKIKISGLLILLVLTQACSSESKQLDAKLAEQPAFLSAVALNKESGNLITTSDLTDQQRSRLYSLRESVQIQNDLLRQDSLHLRSLLIQDALATNYNQREVDLIVSRMRTLEEKKIGVTVAAIKSVSQILEREPMSNRRFLMLNFLESNEMR
jgi:hypothetical protein